MKKIIVILFILAAGRVIGQSNADQRPPVKAGGEQTLSVSSVEAKQLPVKGGVETRAASSAGKQQQLAPLKTGGAASSVAKQAVPVKGGGTQATAARPSGVAGSGLTGSGLTGAGMQPSAVSGSGSRQDSVPIKTSAGNAPAVTPAVALPIRSSDNSDKKP